MDFFANIVSIICVSIAAGDLFHQVHHFERLHLSDLTVITRKKRNIDGTPGTSHQKQIMFTTLGRHFNLILTEGSSVLSPTFKAKTVNKDGVVHDFNVNTNDLYTGHLADDTSSVVDAHMEDGILSAKMYCPEDVYVIEPSWRYQISDYENHSMIAYRSSDVNWDDIYPVDSLTGNRTMMKDGIRLPPLRSGFAHIKAYDNVSETKNHFQSRRSAVQKTICPLLIVADYTFFRDMGNHRRQITASFIIGAIQNVNEHFRRTRWNDGYVEMGFQIDEMMMHTDFAKDPVHYNFDQHWGYNEKLYSFSRFSYINNFCLAHLFTSYAFPENVLGLAFIAPESSYSPGGICSIVSEVDNAPIYPRSGFSSAKNSRGHLVLSLQYQIVTTHELGHNWGAEHDPDIAECAPSNVKGGRYIMWPWSVPGYEFNNQIFSPCTKRSVTPVLKSKSQSCFRVENGHKIMCGNGIIDDGEQCDVGFIELGDVDTCCQADCLLKPGAQCSDFNHACCAGCRIATATVMCQAQNNLTCTDWSYCNGFHLACPTPEGLADNTPCLDGGRCVDGQCAGFCLIEGRKIGKIWKPCLCSQNASAMCRRCCFEVGDNGEWGECLPTSEVLQEGRTCNMGSCSEDGVCIKVEQQLATRIFSFIKHITVSRLVEFMRANIVGTVIVFSAIIWIPVSCLVSRADERKISRDDDYVRRWLSRESSLLGKPEDWSTFHIKNSRYNSVHRPVSASRSLPAYQRSSSYHGAPLATHDNADLESVV